MVNKYLRLLRPVILMAALAVPGQAQDLTKTLLTIVERLMGAQNLRTVQYSGSGSSYNEKGEHSIVTSYSRQLGLSAGTSSLEVVRKQGAPTSTSVTPGSPWNTQVDFLLTPYGFLKGAMANNATREIKKIGEEQYKIISFTAPGNHTVVGYINGKNMVERVDAHLDDGMLIQRIFREYEDFGGLKAPTIVIEKRAEMLSLVVIIKEAKGS